MPNSLFHNTFFNCKVTHSITCHTARFYYLSSSQTQEQKTTMLIGTLCIIIGYVLQCKRRTASPFVIFCGERKQGQMKRQGRILTGLLLFVLLAGACSSEPALNKEKFRKLSQAAQAVKTSRAAGASYQQFGEALQGLSDELTAVRGRVSSKKELEVLNAYETLLRIYQDGHTLWKYKLEFAPFGFVPKGRIYVSQDVDPIAFKYNFPTESHLYLPTQQYWKSISEDSIPIIWKNADFQLKVAEGILNYDE